GCVSAATSSTIAKKASPASAWPGDLVTYTITVTNGGTASGSTTFTDDYDDRLSPSTPTPSPSTGPGCTFDTVAGNKVLDCTTGSILAGGSQTFTYTAIMPSTFTDPGTGCPAGQYAVSNTA